MPELAAFRASLRPHGHTWEPLDDGGYEWCPGCGEIRRHPASDDEQLPD